MYCVNCGKQVDGTIPICQDCALLVLQNSSNIPLSEKVILEAEDFSIKLDSEVAKHEPEEDNKIESPIESPPVIYKDMDNDTILMSIVCTVILIMVTIIITFLILS